MSVSVQYGDIDKIDVNSRGDLRLYETNAKIFPKQRVFHPSGEWHWITDIQSRLVEVGLRPLSECFEMCRRGEL